MTAETDALAATRKSLHGVAELILAGPQYRRSRTIKLRAAPDGFATTAEPDLAVSGDVLFAGRRRIGVLSGVSYAELAQAAGVEALAPQDVYGSGCGADPLDSILVDPVASRLIVRAFSDGDAALRLLEPAAEPVLWPEHFDIGITVGEVNYGVSPGDAGIAKPYAYVGPWMAREGTFWNVPFGAARPLAELPDAGAILGFFAEGRQLLESPAQ